MHAALAAFDTLAGRSDAHVLCLLLIARCWPLLGLAAWVLWPEGPRGASVLGAGALSFALWPLLLAFVPPGEAPAVERGLVISVGVELLRGAVHGACAALPLAAFAWSGALVDIVREAGAVPTFDQPRPVSDLVRFAALAIFCASGGHGLVLSFFVEQLRVHPLGTLPSLDGVGPALLATGTLWTEALALALSLALPVLLCAVLAALVLGLFSRVAAFFTPNTALSLWPILVLGLAALTLSRTLPEVPTAVRVFERHAAAIFRTLG